MKTVLRAKQRVCLCVSDDVKSGGKAKTGTEIEIWNATQSAYLRRGPTVPFND